MQLVSFAILPHKDDIGFSYVLADIGGEEEVPVPALLHNIIKTRLIDGEVVTIPRLDAACGAKL